MPIAAEFHAALQKAFQSASREGVRYVDIQAGWLHRRVGGYPGRNHRMPVCCAAMRAEMQPETRFSPLLRKGTVPVSRLGICCPAQRSHRAASEGVRARSRRRSPAIATTAAYGGTCASAHRYCSGFNSSRARVLLSDCVLAPPRVLWGIPPCSILASETEKAQGCYLRTVTLSERLARQVSPLLQ